MKRLLAAVLLLAVACSAAAFQPRAGVWANLHESGSGYAIEVQENILVMTVYSYQSGGPAQWYLASGPMTNAQHNFLGTLDKYVGGQCISCPYSGGPTLVGNDGTVFIFFSSETTATLTLPGGRTTEIQSLNFGTGDPPTGLLGEWVFVHDQGSTTLADRFNLSSVQAPSSANGTGVVVDPGRNAGCELQSGGPSPGLVICVLLDANNTLLYYYGFRFGLDQTYDGLWFLADGVTFAPMKGFKVRGRCGAGCVNREAAAAESTPETTDAQRVALAVGSAYEQGTVAAVRALVEAARRMAPTP